MATFKYQTPERLEQSQLHTDPVSLLPANYRDLLGNINE